jgi:hypothetical protein
MPFIEAPTTFYLGRKFNPDTGNLIDEVVYYDSRDLTTHAVVVGMTGSGKTGLCINLLEEAAMDNIPAIIIDPKGDITNLMLTFPNLSPDEFLPWINPDEAQRARLSPVEYATDVAQRWRDGLGSWGIGPQRIHELKQRMEFSIFTPGSDAGLSINILNAFSPPPEGWAGHEERHREHINGIVTGLLALTGKKVGPKDREHVLIANIIEFAWVNNLPLDLNNLIIQVQNPPFNQLGVFDVNTFFPEKDRFKLAIELNNIIASPSFQTWTQGEPLDIRTLTNRNGRPRTSIFYIAHLNDEQRSFIITLILEAMVSWMRTLGGTNSLRTLLYFDEVFGHFPPYPKNPPTKDPLLRLLKQGRAFGIGTVLATQNPGDLDYKGLSNAGTWFIGKLQTENDKKKVLDGLVSANSSSNQIDIAAMDHQLSTLSPRVFVMNNIHDSDSPKLVHTRWAMSYLRGPLTRVEVSQLMAPQRGNYAPGGMPAGYAPQAFAAPPAPAPSYQQAPSGFGAPPPPPTLPDFPPSLPEFGAPSGFGQAPAGFNQAPPAAAPSAFGQVPAGFNQPLPPAAPSAFGQAPANMTQAPAPSNGLPQGYNMTPPSLPSSAIQYFLPAIIPFQQALAYLQGRGPVAQNGNMTPILAYQPFLIAQCEVRYMDRTFQLNTIEKYAYHVADLQRSGLIHWEGYTATPIDARSVNSMPDPQSAFGELAPGLSDQKRVRSLEKDVVDFLYKTVQLALPANQDLKIFGVPGMPFQDFQMRVNGVAREQRDAEIDKITQQFAKQLDTLEDRYKTEQRELEADEAALQGLGRESWATMGEAALSLLRGQTTYTVSRVSRVNRYQEQAKQDITESKEQLQQIANEMAQLQQRFQMEVARINDKWGRMAANITQVQFRPNRKDIHLELFGIAWKPVYIVNLGGRPEIIPAWQPPYVQPYSALPPMGYQQPPAPYPQQPAYQQPPAPYQQPYPAQPAPYPQAPGFAQPPAPYQQPYPAQPAPYPQAPGFAQPPAPYPQQPGFAQPPSPYPQQGGYNQPPSPYPPPNRGY